VVNAVDNGQRTAVSTAEMAEALCRFASGVTVTVTQDAEGRPWGFTASAFCSLSMEPPLVLVCLNRNADSFRAFSTCSTFAVHILGVEQRALAVRFATKGIDKFGDSHFRRHPQDGLPTLPGALARLLCAVTGRYLGGDHEIIVGRVQSTETRDGVPLLYYDRAFGTLSPEAAG
jgi:flavin reductase ActVB